MGIKWPHGCSQSKAPFKFHTVLLCFSPHVALDPTNPPHVIRSWISRPACTKCVSKGVSFHSYACVWRWFRDCLPANKDLYILLTQNTGLLSSSLAAAKQYSDLLGRFTPTWPHLSNVSVFCNHFYVCACVNEHICSCLSQCHNPKVIWKVPHLLYKPNAHNLIL